MAPQSLTISLCLIILVGCNNLPGKTANMLTARENALCDSLQIDASLLTEIKPYSTTPTQPFGEWVKKVYGHDHELWNDSVFLKGFVINAPYDNADNLVAKLSDGFAKKGYIIFFSEGLSAVKSKPIAVVKTTDKYAILRQMHTDGINHGITTDSLVAIIQGFDKKYSLDLIGASQDWCEFVIKREPADWLAFAKEVYKVCPDVVDQGAQTVEALATAMKQSGMLYFWWD